MLKSIVLAIAFAGLAAAATPPNIQGVPGATEQADAKVRVFATIYHLGVVNYGPIRGEADEVTLRIATSNETTGQFAATLTYEDTDGKTQTVVLPTVTRNPTWPETYTATIVGKFKRLVSATVTELPPAVTFTF